MCHYVLHVGVCHMSMVVGSSELLISLVNDLNGQLNALAESIKNQEGHMAFKKQLVEFIQFHWDAKRFGIS